MAITVVQTKTGTGGAIYPLSFTSTVTAGNTVIAFLGVTPGGSSPPVCASPTLGGNAVAGTYPIWNDGGNSNAILNTGPGLASCPVWVLPNCPAANGFNLGVQNFGVNADTILYEIAGLGPSPVVNVSVEGSGNSGSTTTVAAGPTGTVTVAPAFVFGCSTSRNGQSAAATGFTCLGPDTSGWAGYQIVTSTGSTYTWTQSTTTNGWTAGVAALVASGTATPTNQFFEMF